MMLKWLFLSWWIAFVSGKSEILVNEPRSGSGLWNWNIQIDSQGVGWIHPSTVNQRYKVCDAGELITREPKNWLRTDFIDVKNAKRLDIEIHYILLNCPITGTSKFCKTYLTLYSYHTDTKEPPPDPTKVMFQKEAAITPKSLPPQGSYKTDVFYGSLVTRARGIYLAFLDQGVCITLTKVVISYRYCPEIVGTLVTFPRTVAPTNDSDLAHQEGKCADVNSVNKGVCLSNGEWNIPDDFACLCKAGYELVNGTIASLECKECPRGSHKSTISNSKCLQCPSNSISNVERTACTCDDGFYNFKTILEAGCKALPLAPLMARITVVKATAVIISWQRSPDDKGNITYAVYCFRCNSGDYKYCKEAYDRQVRFSPGKENITGVTVTVHGLSSSSFFLFRVYSVNELNQQEKDKDKWNYAEVFVETKGKVKCE